MESKIAVPIIELNDVSGIADFIIDYCDLDKTWNTSQINNYICDANCNVLDCNYDGEDC